MAEQNQLGVEALQRDASALFSFVDSVCAYCSGIYDSPAYLAPSLEFFKYIQELGVATKAYLNIFPAKAPANKLLYHPYRQKLEAIRYGWFDFHRLIKPAVDADTLSIPYTLIEALTKRLNGIAGFEDTAFAIFHFSLLNYLEVPIAQISNITEQLKRVIPDAPGFPPNLGLIGIPYSQSSSLYLNSVISHEMGHFVFQHRKLKEKLLPDIQNQLEKALGTQLKDVPSDNLDWSKDRIAAWAEELFCDLFAIWLTGPCYAFTYIEIFGLTTILDPEADSGFSMTAGPAFSRSHPADLFRIKQQAALLKKLHWWDQVIDIKSHYVEVLKVASEIGNDEFEFESSEQDYEDETLEAFLNLTTRVTALLTEVMKDAEGKDFDCGVEGHKRFGKLVGDYLLKAVVPSTVFDGEHHWYPETVTLLNASMRFYLESLEELMKTIKGQKTLLASHRSHWIKKVEALTAKAIEDHYLLVGEKGAVRVDGAFQRADRRTIESVDN